LTPIIPKLRDSIKDLESQFYPYKIDIDLERLYNAYPFKSVENHNFNQLR